jgi:hypothetical protein
MFPKQRREEVIELRKVHRLASQVIASRTGVPLGTVRKWLKAFPLTVEEKRAYWLDANNAKGPRKRMSAEDRSNGKLLSSRKWSEENRRQQSEIVQRKKSEHRGWLLSFKLGLECSRCLENRSACLEFHHRDPERKTLEVLTMVAGEMSKDRIINEVKKSDAIFSIYHRKLHGQERGRGSVAQMERAVVF